MNWDSLLDWSALQELLTEDYAPLAEPVCGSLAVFLSGLPADRQSELLAQQLALDEATPLAVRLGILARGCPVLQKLGQLLARDQRVGLSLRKQLHKLESLPPTVPWSQIEQTLHDELGPLDKLNIQLQPPAIAEASVSVVVPFQYTDGREHRDGVFKLLKPNIEQILEEELSLLEQVGEHLEGHCQELRIPRLEYREAFQQVRQKLSEEIFLDQEQHNLAAARALYTDNAQVHIPALFDECTARVTAMERIWGDKVTDHQLADQAEARRLAETIVEALLARPLLSAEHPAMFHSDPHAGNLFLTREGRLAILDWSLVGRFEKREKIALTQLLLAVVGHRARGIADVLCTLAVGTPPDRQRLLGPIQRGLRALRQGQFPGLFWLKGLLDDAVSESGLRLPPDLVMFRKSLFSLEGVLSDVGVESIVFDRVLGTHFLRQFAREWPCASGLH